MQTIKGEDCKCALPPYHYLCFQFTFVKPKNPKWQIILRGLYSMYTYDIPDLWPHIRSGKNTPESRKDNVSRGTQVTREQCRHTRTHAVLSDSQQLEIPLEIHNPFVRPVLKEYLFSVLPNKHKSSQPEPPHTLKPPSWNVIRPFPIPECTCSFALYSPAGIGSGWRPTCGKNGPSGRGAFRGLMGGGGVYDIEIPSTAATANAQWPLRPRREGTASAGAQWALFF